VSLSLRSFLHIHLYCNIVITMECSYCSASVQRDIFKKVFYVVMDDLEQVNLIINTLHLISIN
jgi:hypothetical protein